jgi:hypothetical protein
VEHDGVDLTRARQRGVGAVHGLVGRQDDVALLGVAELVLAVAAVGG